MTNLLFPVGGAIGNQVFGALSSDLQGIISSIGEHGNLLATTLNTQEDLETIQKNIEEESNSNILSAVQAIASALKTGHDQLSNAMTAGHEKVASSFTAGHDKMTSAISSAHDKVSSVLTNGQEKISAAVSETSKALDTIRGAIQVTLGSFSLVILSHIMRLQIAQSWHTSQKSTLFDNFLFM